MPRTLSLNSFASLASAASAAALTSTVAVLVCSLACSSPEKVIPFPDSGPACGATGHVDCARYPNLTCTTDAATCGSVIFGCVDAAYFTSTDVTACGDGGGD